LRMMRISQLIICGLILSVYCDRINNDNKASDVHVKGDNKALDGPAADDNKALDGGVNDDNKALDGDVKDDNKALDGDVSDDDKELDSRVKDDNKALDDRVNDDNKELDTGVKDDNKALQVDLADSSSDEDLDDDDDDVADSKKGGTCSDTCAEKYDNEKNHEELIEACEEGCRVHVMLQFASAGVDTDAEVDEKCSKGCDVSYTEPDRRDACKLGCQQQKPFAKNGNFEVSIDSHDAMFNVAKSALDGIFERLHQNMFSADSDSNDNPFSDMRREVERMSAIMHQLMDGTQTAIEPMSDDEQSPVDLNDLNNLNNRRLTGHDQLAFAGHVVGNTDDDGNAILHVQIPMGVSDGDEWREIRPALVRTNAESNWISCVADRARRLSLLTQWLVCLALMLCVACMLWICMLIVRQAAQRRRLLEQRAAIPNFYSPLSLASYDEKQPPKELEATQMPFIPAVHQSPPPAYDQLSVK
jgi:hypothetical protein